MSGIIITYGDGQSVSLSSGAAAREVLRDLPEGRRKRILALRIGKRIVDLHSPLMESAEVNLIDVDSPEALQIVRHSASHVMAQAVQDLFPGVKVTIGPAIDTGFYYDFDSEHKFTPDDLEAIEKRMVEILKTDAPFVRTTLPIDKAVDRFEAMGESFKVELIRDLKQAGETEVSLYTHDGWTDLCRGPHLLSTGAIPVVKLMNVAGAYWRGDERNKMLQRIYGTAFMSDKDLKAYLHFLEEAKKRDHRILGKELDLFSFHEEAGAGFALYHPKGGRLRATLEEFERQEHFKRGYEVVYGPQILKKDLWVKSGHFDNYRENMYFTEVEGAEFGIKPMNCLAHMLIYKTARRSYRDLPIRMFELGTVHRHEKSGQLHGLIRVRAFTQDDAHLLCTPDQLNEEIQGVLRFVQDMMALFGFNYRLELSTRPAKSIGSDEVWEVATNALRNALTEMNLPFELNEGDGAFYGPKIDVHLLDSLNRSWQCGTIQCDFAMPERFDLTYTGPDGEEHRPAMIHRTIFGSIDRFLGILIEHFGGAFPTWISPVQAAILTVTDASIDWAKEVERQLRAAGIRVEGDYRNEKLGYKIRHWQKQKAPYMLVIGEKESAEQGVAPRRRKKGEDLGFMPLSDFLSLIRNEIEEKTLT